MPAVAIAIVHFLLNLFDIFFVDDMWFTFVQSGDLQHFFSVSSVGLAISYSFTTPASSSALAFAASSAAVTSDTPSAEFRS